MKAHVVRIGNSRGIRIPKSVIEQCQLHGAVDLIVQPGPMSPSGGNTWSRGTAARLVG